MVELGLVRSGLGWVAYIGERSRDIEASLTIDWRLEEDVRSSAVRGFVERMSEKLEVSLPAGVEAMLLGEKQFSMTLEGSNAQR